MPRWEIVYERGKEVKTKEVEAATLYRPNDETGIVYLSEEEPHTGLSQNTDTIVFLIPARRVISIQKLG